VDRACEQVLADRRYAAADLHVQVARGGLGLGERRLDPFSDEMEGRPALHHDRRPGVVGEDEGRRVVRGIVAPPALPVGPAPIVAGRPEHIAAEDEGAEAFRRGAGEAIVRPAVLADHRSKGPGRVEPIVQLPAPFAERMLQALVRAGAKAVDRHCKTRYAYLTHGTSFPL